jgi:hypothetical protein
MSKNKIMNIELNTILPNPNNPRKINKEQLEQLKNSVSEFTKMLRYRPIVVDNNNMVLGGNMRLLALRELGYKIIPAEWVAKAEDLTEEEKERFIIADNVGFGDWDAEILAGWDSDKLEDWGLKREDWGGGVELDMSELSDEFSLRDGDREKFQIMKFILADEQAQILKEVIVGIKETDEYKYGDTFGNENSNGNALYVIVMQWIQSKKTF